MPQGCSVFNGKIEIRLLQIYRASDIKLKKRRIVAFVTLNNVIDIDMSPAAGCGVHDLQHDVFAGEFTDIPLRRFQMLAAARVCVRSSRGTDHVSVEQQVHAGLAFPAATADEKLQILALDFKRGRSQRARRCVAAIKRIHQAISVETVDRHLVRQSSVSRPGSKRVAACGPSAVIGSFEVLDQDIRPLCHRAEEPEPQDTNQGQDEFTLSHLSALKVAVPPLLVILSGTAWRLTLV